MSLQELTLNERTALEVLIAGGGSVLTTAVPDKNEPDEVFRGFTVPGHGVYKKLERRGLVFYTVEDPLDAPGDPLDGFQFTNEICITEAGRAALLPVASKRQRA